MTGCHRCEAQATEIARSNFFCALDQGPSEENQYSEYQNMRNAVAAYLINAIDTAGEEGLHRETVAAIYLGLWDNHPVKF